MYRLPIEKLKLLGNRLILREHRAEVSQVIQMLEYENSTWEVVASGVKWLKPGQLVIVDRHGSNMSFFELNHHMVVASEHAVIATVEGDEVEPAPGFVLGSQVEETGLILVAPKRHREGELIRIGNEVYIVAAGSGYYIWWKGKKLRLVAEDDLLANVEGYDEGCS